MKKLLMTTILASSISFTAMADVTKSDIEKGIAAGNSAVCNTLDHGVQFNKTELSQFDKCWLSIHKADETAGTLGNVFWIKAGDKFISMPVKALAQSGSKAKAKEIIKEKIIEEVTVERIVERVTVDTAEIERLQGVINTLTPIADRVPGLVADIDAKRMEIARLTGFARTEYTRGYNLGNDSIKNDVRDDINNFFGTSHATFADAINFLATAELEDGHRSTITQRTGSNIFDATGANAGVYYNQAYVQESVRVSGMFIAANAISNELVNEGYDSATFSFRNVQSAINGATSLNDAVRNMVEYVLDNLPAPSLTYGAMPGDANNDGIVSNQEIIDRAQEGPVDGDNNWQVSHNPGTSGFDVVTPTGAGAGSYITNANGDIRNLYAGFLPQYAETQIEAAIEEAYNSGYDNGYNDGYADGYRDGFNDGVASVSN